MQAAFHHSLAAGREALRLSAGSEAIVHFERARQIAQEMAQPDMPDDAELQELKILLDRAYRG